MISVSLGSAVFANLLAESYQKIIGASLAFTSALLVALQTFLNPKKMEKDHRSVGNRYLEISRSCRLINAKLSEEILSLGEATEQYESILSSYNDTNIEAEVFPISKKDFQNSIKMSQEKII